MARPVLSAAHFHNEEAAFEYVEARLWPEGPVCPHCGNVDQKAIGRLTGKSSRPGLRKCYACRKTFTVRIGSIFEDSHFPLHLWLQAIQLITASKKGFKHAPDSADLQLQHENRVAPRPSHSRNDDDGARAARLVAPERRLKPTTWSLAVRSRRVSARMAARAT